MATKIPRNIMQDSHQKEIEILLKNAAEDTDHFISTLIEANLFCMPGLEDPFVNRVAVALDIKVLPTWMLLKKIHTLKADEQAKTILVLIESLNKRSNTFKYDLESFASHLELVDFRFAWEIDREEEQWQDYPQTRASRGSTMVHYGVLP